MRGQAKDGTTRFYRVATAYVIHKGLRLTLALRFVLPTDDTLTVLQHLLAGVRAHQLTLRCVYLDKGFAGSAVVTYLTEQHIPAIVACAIRGTHGGTRALCHGRKSYRTTYTFNVGQPEAYTATLAVCRVFTTAARTQRLPRRAEWLLFIVIGVDWSAKQVQRQYRRRFGIESSYRCAGQVCGWTTSPNAAYRFVLIALSFILVNVWLQVRWRCCQIARRGARRLADTAFQLTRLVNFLRRALERLYGYVSVIEVTVPPRP